MNKKILSLGVILLLFTLVIGCSGKPKPPVNPAPVKTSAAMPTETKASDVKTPSPAVTPTVTETLSSPKPTEKPSTPTPVESPTASPTAESSKSPLKPDPGMADVEEARRLLEGADYSGAMKYLKKAIKKNPQLAPAYAYRGKVYLETQDYDRAKRDIEKAIALDPDNADAHFFNGILLEHKYDEGAVKEYNRAIELDPDNVEALYRRGRLYGNRGDYDKARRDYEKVIKLDPTGVNGRLAAEELSDIKE